MPYKKIRKKEKEKEKEKEIYIKNPLIKLGICAS